MMTDDCGGEGPFRNPESSGGSLVGLHLYVEDADIVFAQAVSAGATAWSLAIILRVALYLHDLHAPARTQAHPLGARPFPLPFKHISSATSAGIGNADTL
ncbi:MAG TPA: hypothetical protein VGP12_06115 [Nitrosospira sp.]|jgi:hypothetical protein|nr:hypothetical protein [Nitrosospira sp.]